MADLVERNQIGSKNVELNQVGSRRNYDEDPNKYLISFLQENDIENAKVAEVRKERLQKERLQIEEEIKQNLLEAEQVWAVQKSCWGSYEYEHKSMNPESRISKVIKKINLG